MAAAIEESARSRGASAVTVELKTSSRVMSAFGARSHFGGRSLATARRTVVREIPNFRAIARIGICSARCNRRISVQSSTLITHPPGLTQRVRPPRRATIHPVEVVTLSRCRHPTAVE
jgi:hypothetical protein